MTETKVDHEREFIDLVPKAAKLHPLTWCVLRQRAVPTVFLLKMRCWECHEFILNDGICDPL